MFRNETRFSENVKVLMTKTIGKTKVVPTCHEDKHGSNRSAHSETRRYMGVVIMLWPLYPRQITPVPTEGMVMRIPQPVWR